jgi:hypothetical protein
LAGAVGNLPIADDAPGEAAAKGTAISFGQQLATEQRRKRDAEARSRPIPLTNPPSISARILLFEESGPVEYQYVDTSLFAGLTSIDLARP